MHHEIAPYRPRQLVRIVCALLIWTVAAGAAQQQEIRVTGEVSFRPARRDFLSGSLPRDLAPVDFDEDGRMDVAVVRFNLGGPGVLELLRGDGAGGFERRQSYLTAVGATSIAVADLNEDGHADLVTSGFLDNTLGLHLGNGAGEFLFTSLPFPGDAPFHVTTADVDGDLHDDLIAAAGNSQAIFILRGDGQGGFFPAIELPAGVLPQHVACGDLDGDDNVDLAVADADGDQVLLFIADGMGGFLPPQIINPGAHPAAVDIDDQLPGPALLAVAVRNDHLARVYEWDGASGAPLEIAVLSAGGYPQAVRLVRFAGDTVGLVAAAQSSDELVFYSELTAEPQLFITQNSPTAVAVADWSGDGIADFMLPGFNTESVSLHLGSGAGSVERAPSVEVTGGVASLQPVDFDGDPQPDLAVLRIVDRQVTVLRGVTPIQYLPIDVGEQLPELPTGFAVLEVDGDNQPDFAIGHATGSQLWLLRSSAAYACSTFTMGGSGATAIVADDLDDDGDDDLAITLFLSSMVAILAGDGAGGFNLPQLVPVGLEPEGLTIGDWNGDGRRDLATVNGGGLSVTVLLQDEQGLFHVDATIPVAVGTPVGLATGQLFGGIHDDLVVTGSAGVEVLAGDGTGAFNSVQLIITGAEFEGARIADMNGDGYDDLIAADRTGHGIVIYPGRPPSRVGPLQEQVAFGTNRGPVEQAALDLNADGVLDLAVVSRLAGRVTLLLSAAVGEPTLSNGRQLRIDESLAATANVVPVSAPPVTTTARAWPNPFRVSMSLSLDLGHDFAGEARVRIYDVAGRLVAQPFTGRISSGAAPPIEWNGRDLRGAEVPGGVYFYRVDLRSATTAAHPAADAAADVLRGRIVRQ